MESSQEWLERSTAYPFVFFLTLTEQILDMIQENPFKAKFFIMLAQALRSTTTPHKIATLLEKQADRWTKTVVLIQKGQQMGKIREGSPEALACTFWCSLQGVVEQLAIYPQTPFPQAEWIVAILKK